MEGDKLFRSALCNLPRYPTDSKETVEATDEIGCLGLVPRSISLKLQIRAVVWRRGAHQPGGPPPRTTTAPPFRSSPPGMDAKRIGVWGYGVFMDPPNVSPTVWRRQALLYFSLGPTKGMLGMGYKTAFVAPSSRSSPLVRITPPQHMPDYVSHPMTRVLGCGDSPLSHRGGFATSRTIFCLCSSPKKELQEDVSPCHPRGAWHCSARSAGLIAPVPHNPHSHCEHDASAYIRGSTARL